MEQLYIHSKAVRLFFFWSGIIATVAYRIIVVLNFYSPVWVQIAWYIGTVGFIVYFIHRYQISEKRARIIAERHLVEKVGQLPIEAGDREALGYILNTLRSSKEKWNSIIIFILSGLALGYGIAVDFIIPLLQ